MLSMINSMKKYLIMNKVGIVSAFLLGFQDLGLVQQWPVVTQNLEDLCDNQLFFASYSPLLHLLICCELGLHFEKKSGFEFI